MNWMQVEAYLQHDDRAVLPLGSTEQHSHLRLTVDCILPERVAAEAAEPLGVPVFPVRAVRRHAVLPRVPRLDLAQGRDPSARRRRHPRRPGAQRLPAHPDRQRARRQQRRAAVRDRSGRPITRPAACSSTTGGTRRAPGPRCRRIDPVASHGSWMENFPWTRLPGVDVPGAAAADGRPGAGARRSIRSRCARISATATSAGSTSARTTRCSRCGRSRSRRRARCSTGSWGDAS